jgi:glycosyltransferase involved in cell wall biosynthesis
MTSILSQKLGIMGKLIGRHYYKIEKKMLLASDSIIAITGSFATILKDWQIELEKVHIIPNWGPLNSIPVKHKLNPFCLEYGLCEKFVVLYSGTLGMKQNPNIIIQAALHLKNQKNIMFVVISNGVGMEYLVKKKEMYNLDNLLLLPMQPYERVPDILATADLGLVLLNPNAGTFCVPSKVWSIFCSARPSILVVPENNMAARVTTINKAGIVLPPQESKKLATTILDLSRQPEQLKLMGMNGRKYAEKHFQIEDITQKFEDILNGVLKVNQPKIRTFAA